MTSISFYMDIVSFLDHLTALLQPQNSSVAYGYRSRGPGWTSGAIRFI
jgi:hypothetical protein